MSDTPRTKARTFQIIGSLQSGIEEVVHAGVAAQLERELAEMTQFRDLLANKEMELLKQLTAHKAALEKCERLIMFAMGEGEAHVGATMFIEALSEITKLKGNQ